LTPSLSPSNRAFKSLGIAKGTTGALRRARRGVAKGATGALRVIRAIWSVPAMQIETQSAGHLCSPSNQAKTTLHHVQRNSN
jgi:hypothetical protein